MSRERTGRSSQSFNGEKGGPRCEASRGGGGGGSRVQAGVGEVCPRERERLSEGRWAGRWKPQYPSGRPSTGGWWRLLAGSEDSGCTS